MLCTSSGTPVGAGPTGNERHDAHYSGQMRPGRAPSANDPALTATYPVVCAKRACA